MPVNEYYDSSGVPSTGSQGSSAAIRAELDAIEAAFNKLPVLAANGDKAVFINTGGTALSAIPAVAARANLGLVIGTDVQAFDTDLTALAATATTGLYTVTGAGTSATRTLTAGSSKISISNGGGVAANPSIDVAEANLTLNNIGGTLDAAKGGTGRASHTAYAIICGGTTTTAPQQSVASVGTAGQVLTSSGAGTLPTFQALIPSTTRMLFQQTSAPTGWTKETNAAYNDIGLRVVTGAAGSGGTVAFSTVFSTSRATDSQSPATNAVSPGTGDAASPGTNAVSPGTGDAASPGTNAVSPGSTDGHVLTIAQMPAHNHPGTYFGSAVSVINAALAGDTTAGTGSVPSQGGGGAHSHTIGTTHSHTVNSHTHAHSATHSHTVNSHTHAHSATHSHTVNSHAHNSNLNVSFRDIIVATKD
jgi:hypothetical protein